MSQSTEEKARLGVAAQAGLLAGPFLTMVDSNIVNVAIPDIARELRTPLGTAQWVVSGYLLALAAMLAGTAFLARRFGTRRVYLASLLCFALTSALCALAPSIEVLVAARALQGAAGAPLVPLAMSMLLGGQGAARRMPAAAGVLLFLAPAVGPTIGGVLILLAGWPAIFMVNVPFALLGFLGMRQAALPQEEQNTRAPFDPVGLALLASGLALAVYGAAQGPVVGWLSVGAWPFWATGMALLAIYTRWSALRAHPAVDLHLLRHASTALAVCLSSLASVVMFAMLFLIPVFLQNVQGLSPFQAGLVLLPQGLVTGIGTVVGERAPARFGVRYSVALGMAILAVCTAPLLFVRSDTPAWYIAALLCGRGLALGLTIQPLLHSMLGDLDTSQMADATTLFNMAQRLAGSIGIALLATFFALAGFTQVIGLLVVLAVVGIAGALLLQEVRTPSDLRGGS